MGVFLHSGKEHAVTHGNPLEELAVSFAAMAVSPPLLCIWVLKWVATGFLYDHQVEMDLCCPTHVTSVLVPLYGVLSPMWFSLVYEISELEKINNMHLESAIRKSPIGPRKMQKNRKKEPNKMQATIEANIQKNTKLWRFCLIFLFFLQFFGVCRWDFECMSIDS